MFTFRNYVGAAVGGGNGGVLIVANHARAEGKGREGRIATCRRNGLDFRIVTLPAPSL